MEENSFDFKALGEALQADTQEFLDSYATRYPEDGPVLAFCLYFDSSMDATGMMLPQQAVNETVGASLDDVASWFRYDDHVQASLSETTVALFETYQELFYESEEDEKKITKQFKQMIREVMQLLSFDKVSKTDDFIFFAEGMDEDYKQWKETIPLPLLKKHFGI